MLTINQGYVAWIALSTITTAHTPGLRSGNA
jgi:hypothetical protein